MPPTISPTSLPSAQAPPTRPTYAPPVQQPPQQPAQYNWQAARPAVAYAGFWLRFVAYIIDSMILGAVVGVGIFAPLLGGTLQRMSSDNPWELYTSMARPIVAIKLLALMAGWIYFASMESSGWQATRGKKALGLKVTDLAGNRITFARFGTSFRKTAFRNDADDWFRDGWLYRTQTGSARPSCGLSGPAPTLKFLGDGSADERLKCSVQNVERSKQREWHSVRLVVSRSAACLWPPLPPLAMRLLRFHKQEDCRCTEMCRL